MTRRIAHLTTVDLTLEFLLRPQLCRLLSDGYEVTGISAPGPWVDQLQAEGIRHIDWPHVTRSWAPLSDLRAMISLVRILKSERFDLVHTHNPKPGLMGRIAARLVGVPCVVNTVHGLYAMPDDRWRRKALVLPLEWLAARFSDLELYQSEEDLEWARRLGLVSESKSRLLGNGIDLTKFAPDRVSSQRRDQIRKELGVSDGALVVGTVGRIVEEKGYRDFFAAARMIRELDPKVEFVVVGEVDEKKQDAVPVEVLNAARADVVFTGWRTDVSDLLAAMDVFVLASRREGVPRSAIEAAAMGMALVLTDIRGCREVVRHEVDGLLVPSRNPKALADAILRLLREPLLRQRLGRAARRRAEGKFDESQVVGTLSQSYLELFSSKGLFNPSETPPQVRRARPNDAKVIARLHRQTLPEAFLPTLGEAFLTRLYRGLIAYPSAVMLVAEVNGETVGFACGVLAVGKFYRRFLFRRGVGAAIVAAPRLLRPRVLRQAFETLRYPGNTERLPEAELLSIGVEAAHRKSGLGRTLVERLLDGLRALGADEVKVVVSADNLVANRFYRECGFLSAAEIHIHEEVSNVLVSR